MSVNAAAKQIELTSMVPPDVPAVVLGDPTRLRQVLMNLVGNAIKFTERGTITLQVHTDGPERLRFIVSDTGIGIPEDKLDTIFDPFTQLDSTTRRRYGGTGLGLSITKQLIHLMQGEIAVESTVGEGSRFTFGIQAQPVEQHGVTASANEDRQQPKTGSPASPPALRILVVDDLEDNREIVALFLKDRPYRLDMAENGLVALTTFQQTAYDLVLMDIQMPIMDGLETTMAIRKWEREQHRSPTPIIAFTAHALKEEQDKSLHAGCTAHLTKPIKKQALLTALATYARPVTDHAA